MEINRPYFGTMSGMATALGLLPHILVLFFLMVLKPPSATTSSIIVFTIGSKILGDWLFYSFFSNRLDGMERLNKWRTSLSKSLFFHNNVHLSVVAFVSDHLIDILLIQAALKTQMHPTQVFCTFLGCQAI